MPRLVESAAYTAARTSSLRGQGRDLGSLGGVTRVVRLRVSHGNRRGLLSTSPRSRTPSRICFEMSSGIEKTSVRSWQSALQAFLSGSRSDSMRHLRGGRVANARGGQTVL